MSTNIFENNCLLNKQDIQQDGWIAACQKMRKNNILRISRHFGTENYTWILDVAQKPSWILSIFLVCFFGLKMPPFPPPPLHATIQQYLAMVRHTEGC